jgi:hypothetical protein
MKIKSKITNKVNSPDSSGLIISIEKFKNSKGKPVYDKELYVGTITKISIDADNRVTATWIPERGGYDNCFLKVAMIDDLISRYNVI